MGKVKAPEVTNKVVGTSMSAAWTVGSTAVTAGSAIYRGVRKGLTPVVPHRVEE